VFEHFYSSTYLVEQSNSGDRHEVTTLQQLIEASTMQAVRFEKGKLLPRLRHDLNMHQHAECPVFFSGLQQILHAASDCPESTSF
jgi:hypothetical protein